MFSTAMRSLRAMADRLDASPGCFVLTSISTRLGRKRKERLGTAEKRRGREASQVAANLGMAALVSSGVAQTWQINQSWLQLANLVPSAVFTAGLAALCEAAADTVSSEFGQVLDSRPRMITTLRVAEPGTDGAISFGGTHGRRRGRRRRGSCRLSRASRRPNVFAVSWVGGVFGLLFDSVLGATLERRGWLNNDAVNFLSTASAAAFALAALSVLTHQAAHNCSSESPSPLHRGFYSTCSRQAV